MERFGFQYDPPLFHIPPDESSYADDYQAQAAGATGFAALYNIDFELTFIKPVQLVSPFSPTAAPSPVGAGGAVNPTVAGMTITGYSETGVPLVTYGGYQYSQLALTYGLACIAFVDQTEGGGLEIGSGYRSDSQQAGLASADPQNAAAPGRSEHRTGHAFDLGVGGGAYSDRRLQAAHDWVEGQGGKALVHGNAGGGGYHTHCSVLALA